MVQDANCYRERLKTLETRIQLAKMRVHEMEEALHNIAFDGFNLGPLSAVLLRKELTKRRKKHMTLVMMRRALKKEDRKARGIKHKRD